MDNKEFGKQLEKRKLKIHIYTIKIGGDEHRIIASSTKSHQKLIKKYKVEIVDYLDEYDK